MPKGQLWVMGDHRGNSADSRDHNAAHAADGGFVPTHKVIGRAFIKVWPFSHFGVLHVPKTFSQKALHTIGGPAAADPPLALGVFGALPVAAAAPPAGAGAGPVGAAPPPSYPEPDDLLASRAHRPA